MSEVWPPGQPSDGVVFLPQPLHAQPSDGVVFLTPRPPAPSSDGVVFLPTTPHELRRRTVGRAAVVAGVAVTVVVSAWSGFGDLIDRSRGPLGDPTAYAFMKVQADGVTPVAFDGCRPIHYVTRPDGAPRNGQLLIAQAVERIAAATGLTFVDDGVTTAAPNRSYRFNGRWPPVLFAWTTPAEDPEISGSVVGAGGPARITTPDGTIVAVTGSISLDAEALDAMEDRRHGVDQARAVVMHELAHVVGLSHVDEGEKQLMGPETRRDVTDLGAGDLAGLRLLGQGACFSDVELRG